MSSTINPIQIEAFEQIRASAQTALLRLIYRIAESRDAQARVSRLVVNNHNSIHRLAPLPGPPAPSGPHRAAFAVPFELLEGDRTFSVEFEDGMLVELPYPIAGSAGAPSSADRDDGPRHRGAYVEHLTSDRGVHRHPLDQLSAELGDEEDDPEDELLAEAEARAAAESDAEALRERVAQVKAEAEEAMREMQSRCSELERRLADALAELEAVTKAERRAVRETRQLRDAIAQQQQLIDELQPHAS
jgi:hypothetical protein